MDKELIERLAKRAGISIDLTWGTTYTGNVQLAKFANLVAQECAKECIAGWDMTCDEVAANIGLRFPSPEANPAARE